MAYEAGVGGMEFWDMCMVDINRKIEAYNNNQKAEWERARMGAYYSIAPHLDSKRDNSIIKIIPLPWDEKPKSKNRKITDKEKAWIEKQKKRIYGND